MPLFAAPAEAIAEFLRSRGAALRAPACQRPALRRHRPAGKAGSESAELASHGQSQQCDRPGPGPAGL